MGAWKLMRSLNTLRSFGRVRVTAAKLQPTTWLLKSTETKPHPSSRLIPVRHFCDKEDPYQDELPRLRRRFRGPLNKEEAERKVLYPGTLDIEKVRDTLQGLLGHLKNAGVPISAVYYGVSVVKYKGNITDEEEKELNEEVALRDAVRNSLYEYYTGQESQPKMCPLGEEPTLKWILEDRVQSRHPSEPWDVVISVGINEISPEEWEVEYEKIRQRGSQNVFWCAITKGQMSREPIRFSQVRGVEHTAIASCGFVSMFIPRCFFWNDGVV
ncbi:hypothetical protein IFM89_019481 [Coptis chinensis]|uniref:Uncharacterized protein n=1 Tax=Coptis chinensis TaxID=261450 RepID=A0A835LC90_9MAGN|nr:hypothetical protein IFM89_019481 [Coptis chinensis]